MLNIYATDWCPHCTKTVNFLKKHKIQYNYINMDKDVTNEQLRKVIEVNGGDDWVVPTLEFNGKWREGKFFNAEQLMKELTQMGVVDRF